MNRSKNEVSAEDLQHRCPGKSFREATLDLGGGTSSTKAFDLPKAGYGTYVNLFPETRPPMTGGKANQREFLIVVDKTRRARLAKRRDTVLQHA